MKTKLLLFLLLSISLFSNTPDLFNNLNLETNNKESLLSVPPSDKESFTAKKDNIPYNSSPLESEFTLDEESKPKFKSYWQNIEDLIFITKFLNKSVTYRPKVDEEELSFYKTQFNLEVKKLKKVILNLNPNNLKGRTVSTPTKGAGGVYQFEINGKVKTGSTQDFYERYNGENIVKEFPQTRHNPAAFHKDYKWTPRRQRRFDEMFIDLQVPKHQRYRHPTHPKSPVSQKKWEKFKHIFGY